MELIGFWLAAGIKGLSRWPLIIARNNWFQRKVVNYLSRYRLSINAAPIVFSYSYAALEIFRFAKSQGWKTVLGQIDPGPVLDRVSWELVQQSAVPHIPPPQDYWRDWKQECKLADHIVVNSDWSRQCLEGEGVQPAKIRIIPLAYEPPTSASNFTRNVLSKIDIQRPLTVLFLGQVTLAKGIVPLLQAARMLTGQPVRFWIVGPVQFDIDDEWRSLSNVSWYGKISRAEAAEFFKAADVFVFPSYCDGFGLTQLEAQSWRLPVIASRNCGEVVSHNVNGLLLDEVSADEICKVLGYILRNPQVLNEWSSNSDVNNRFSLSEVGRALLDLVDQHG